MTRHFHAAFTDELTTLLVSPMAKEAAVLTQAGRNRLKKKQFALPAPKGAPQRGPTGVKKPKGSYPIYDRVHARVALSRVSQHGTPEEQARVRAAVYRKYPDMGKGSAKK